MRSPEHRPLSRALHGFYVALDTLARASGVAVERVVGRRHIAELALMTLAPPERTVGIGEA
jgi:hypothetical protein